MKFELTDGTIVEPEQDCNCITHTGPHWLHANDIWREQNKRLLRPDFLSLEGLAREEQRRLQDKLYHMKRYGISKIIRS